MHALEPRKTHEDQKYIDALVNNDHKLIEELYKKFAPKIISYVRKNSGDESAARDIIQETLITLYDQAKTKGLQLTCPFDAYFFLICKRKWLNAIKKNHGKEVTIEEEFLYRSEEPIDEVVETEEFETQPSLYISMLSKIGDTCKQIITLGLSNMSMQEVADQLGITYAYAR